MTMKQRRTGTIAIGVILTAISACTGGAIKKPLSTSPVASGINTVESVRKELEGAWTLVSLVVQNATGGRATPEATGTLTSDAYGNLKIEYRLSDSGLKALEAIGVRPPTPVIVTDGRAVINPQDKSIQYVSARRVQACVRSGPGGGARQSVRVGATALLRAHHGRHADAVHAARQRPGRRGEPLEERLMIRLSATTSEPAPGPRRSVTLGP